MSVSELLREACPPCPQWPTPGNAEFLTFRKTKTTMRMFHSCLSIIVHQTTQIKMLEFL